MTRRELIEYCPIYPGAPDSFASGVAAADSILPPQMFSDLANGRVA